MPKQIVLFLCIALIFYLVRQDAKKAPNVSYALWLPWIWFVIHATRAVSSWFGYGDASVSSDYYLEGSPLDRNIFIAMIITGIIILSRRQTQWGDILKNNKFIFLYIIYLGLSSLWSDYTFISFKRWIKEIGNIIMVLIVLTEASPAEAIKTMILRCAYVLVPLSLVLNRYFPELSRFYSVGGGDPQLTGVTTNKNSLGLLCLIIFVVLFWSFVTKWYQKQTERVIKELLIYIFLFILIGWLMQNARSATALAGAIIGVFMIVALSMNHVRNNTRLIYYYTIACIIGLLIINLSFDTTSLVTSSLGRDDTLTGRTEFWQELIAFNTSSLIGTGYESFWMGDRIAYFWNKYWWHPNQAHNGYLELYLNIGLIGLTFLLCVIISSVRNIMKNISAMNNYDYQILRFTFILVVLIINVTEAYFKGPAWLVFLLMAIEPPSSAKAEYEAPF